MALNITRSKRDADVFIARLAQLTMRANAASAEISNIRSDFNTLRAEVANHTDVDPADLAELDAALADFRNAIRAAGQAF